MKLFHSSKSLLKRYGEAKLYVTDIIYSRNDEPAAIYIFLPEFYTDVVLNVNAVLNCKRLRSSDQTLYHISLDSGLTLLLSIDHMRGNHYAHFTQLSYLQLINHYKNFHQPTEKQSAAASQAILLTNTLELSIHDARNKVVFVDSYHLIHFPQTVEKLAKFNEIVINPYFDFQSLYYEEIVEFVSKLKRLFPNRIINDSYADLSGGLSSGYDLSNENDYLLALANQLPLTKSQIAFLVIDEEFIQNIHHRGYSIIKPEGSSSVRPAPDNRLLDHGESYTKQTYPRTHPNNSNDDTDSLPPRSSKHRKQSTPFYSSIRSFLYNLF
jgi:hypothetical protein